MSEHAPVLPAVERETFRSALAAGQAPPEIAPSIQVGRRAELIALKLDIDLVGASRASFRIIIGPVGSGKTQLVNTAAAMAVASGLVVAQAVITRDRRPHGTQGEPRNLLVELIKRVRVKGNEPGTGLQHLLDCLWQRISAGNSITEKELAKLVRRHCKPLLALNKGDSLVQVLVTYFHSIQTGDDVTRDKALSWMRAQCVSVQEAKRVLGISTIIDGSDFHDYLKLLAALARLAGFSGLMVCLDEMGTLCNLPQPNLRRANFEVIHTLIDDCHQGRSPGLGVIMAGTTDFLEHRDRGLYSYEPLSTRLGSVGAGPSSVNNSGGPVIRLQRLSNEEFLLLLHRVRDLLSDHGTSQPCLPDDALLALLKLSLNTIGAKEFLDPRQLLRHLAHLVLALEQNPDKNWKELLGVSSDFQKERPIANLSAPAPVSAINELENLKL